ncbi:hypothetical protein ACVDFE_30615 [Lentzea chajnantorensis]
MTDTASGWQPRKLDDRADRAGVRGARRCAEAQQFQRLPGGERGQRGGAEAG